MSAQKGSVTIFLALMMMTFLILCLVLLEGTRVYFLRTNAVQAMELAEFSVLSEYQQELFKHYGLFFLDLDYEQGSEHIGILETRLSEYLNKNMEEIQTENLKVKNICRATDAEGSHFFKQAAEVIKVQSGYKIFEEIFENAENIELEEVDLEEILEKQENAAEEALDSWKEDENFSISLPDISFPSMKALREAVFGEETGLSEKSVNLSERISERNLSVGSGKEGSHSFAEMELFHSYLFKYFGYYGDENPDVWDSSLEYQLEYILAGEKSDLDNLENMMWRIFLLRAGGNYLFYHQDPYEFRKAQTEATALVGFLGNPILIEAVTEILLVSRAIEDGIVQTRRIFAGEKVPLYENGTFSGILLGYEEYLYLFLKTEKRKNKIFRCMDLVELEVRKKSGYERFYLDHCTDWFEVQWNYQFDSLFQELGYFANSIYKNEINRKVFYEN